MRKMAEIVGERRDDLARTLSLDQGKPLQAEARSAGGRVGERVGRVGGRFSMECLTELKTVVVDLD